MLSSRLCSLLSTGSFSRRILYTRGITGLFTYYGSSQAKFLENHTNSPTEIVPLSQIQQKPSSQSQQIDSTSGGGVLLDIPEPALDKYRQSIMTTYYKVLGAGLLSVVGLMIRGYKRTALLTLLPIGIFLMGDMKFTSAFITRVEQIDATSDPRGQGHSLLKIRLGPLNERTIVCASGSLQPDTSTSDIDITGLQCLPLNSSKPMVIYLTSQPEIREDMQVPSRDRLYRALSGQRGSFANMGAFGMKNDRLE